MAALPCGSPLTRTRSRRLRRRILLRSTVDRAVLPREALLLLRPLPVVRSVKKQLLLDYLVPPPDAVDSDPTDTLLKYFRDSNKTDPGADNRPCPVPARRALRESSRTSDMPGFFADSRDRAQRVTACPEIHPRPKRGRSCFSRISDPLDRRHGFL